MQYFSSIPVSFISMTSVCSSEEVEQVQKIMISEPNIQHGHEHTKWMSSKMRLMKKMMNSDQAASTSKPRRTHSVPESGVIRVCSDCNTTKTPLWRSGPQGPKSLCNACGIRQRKARKLQSMMISSDGDRQGDHAMPFKKRFKITGTESSAFHQRLLPQDEKDAAILLMALSCGLLHG